MHADQLDIDEPLVHRLIADQLPQWRDLPLSPVPSHGTVNALYRLGEEIVLRLPMQASTTDLAAEAEACRRFAQVLQVAVPEPLFLGEPTADYPVGWAAYRWIEGEPAQVDRIGDPHRFAEDLAEVVHAVRSVDPGGRSWPGAGRGGPMASVDADVRDDLERSNGLVDTVGLTTVWEECLVARPADAESWTHNDLMPGNLLVHDGGLTAVIDWGQCQVADPSVDLQPAWNLLPAGPRETFRVAVGADDDAWVRGRGWALAQAIGCLWYYRETNPPMSETGRRTLEALLE